MPWPFSSARSSSWGSCCYERHDRQPPPREHRHLPAARRGASTGVLPSRIGQGHPAAFLTPLALLSSRRAINDRVKEFSFFMLVLETAMIGVFVSLNLFLFYVFWEAMLIPMYFLIGLWGGRRRVYATTKV